MFAPSSSSSTTFLTRITFLITELFAHLSYGNLYTMTFFSTFSIQHRNPFLFRKLIRPLVLLATFSKRNFEWPFEMKRKKNKQNKTKLGIWINGYSHVYDYHQLKHFSLLPCSIFLILSKTN